MAASLPTWVYNSQSPRYLADVCNVLKERERARTYYRYLSLPENAKSLDSELRTSKNSQLLRTLVRRYSVSVGSRNPQNRYADIMPYNRTLAFVSQKEPHYLNANWVLECHGGKYWIASQAPVPSAFHTFLSLILQSEHTLPSSNIAHPGRIRTVVQLTRNIEDGRRKADAYFPLEVGKYIMIAPENTSSTPLKVTLLESKEISEARCILSTVSISVAGETVIFRHLLYCAWPDHGVPDPEERSSLLEFTILVDKMNRDTSPAAVNPDPPIIVGCSAGVGRTGCFIAISSLLRTQGFLEAATISENIPTSPLSSLPTRFKDDPVIAEIDSLREQRPGMVQHDEQIMFIYEMLRTTY